MENRYKTMGKFKTNLAIAVGGLAAIVGGATIISGCEAKPEYETRIENCFQDSTSKKYEKELLRLYKSINPENLTEKQKEYLAEFEENKENYKDSAWSWMNPDNLTVRDKIFIGMDEYYARGMMNAVGSAFTPLKSGSPPKNQSDPK